MQVYTFAQWNLGNKRAAAPEQFGLVNDYPAPYRKRVHTCDEIGEFPSTTLEEVDAYYLRNDEDVLDNDPLDTIADVAALWLLANETEE
jgi:hypothetical protein